MASFVYTIYDTTNNNDPVDVYYQFYHTNTKKLSDIRESVDHQVSFDSDDSDINNQEAPFKKGDTGLLILWTGNIDRFDETIQLNLFGVLKINGDGSDVYVDDIYLYGSQYPTGKIYNISNDYITTENNVEIVPHVSDEYKIDNLYQKNNWYGIVIFPQIKIIDLKYNFGEGYSSVNTYKYKESGEYIIKVSVENFYNQITIIEKSIKIYNPVPIISLSCSPEKPYLDEIYTLNCDIISDNIKQVDYYMDDVQIDNLGGIFEQIKTHKFKIISTYFNGFDDDIVIKTLDIDMSLNLPTVKLNYENNLDDDNKTFDYIFNSFIYKGDGDIIKVNYLIFYILPFKGIYEHILSKSNILNTDNIYIDEEEKEYYKDNLNITFNESGTYKIISKVTDEYNNIATSEIEINISCDEVKETHNKQIVMLFDQE